MMNILDTYIDHDHDIDHVDDNEMDQRYTFVS